MPPPPPSIIAPRYRRPLPYAVLLGDNAGNRPAITDVVDFLEVEDLQSLTGAERLDSIRFKIDLEAFNARLQDTTTPTGFNRVVEVRGVNPLTGKLDRCLGWGRLAAQPQRIDGSSETVGMTARLDHFLFGTPLRGYQSFEPISETEVFVATDVPLNPEIDGTLFPNRSSQVNANGARYLLHPESLRSGPARTLQAATATRCDLTSTIFMLCWLMNADEDWITNPTLAELTAVCGSNEILLENVTLERGPYLPVVLDKLLERFGFTWFVEHSIDTTDAALPVTSKIRVLERGVGPKVSLRMQRLCDRLDNAQTNVHELGLTYDIAARPNVISGFSALALREGTFELGPSWFGSQDTLTIADLEIQDPMNVDVFRQFVLNEAGDQIGKRVENTDATDLNPLFGRNTVPRRRRFLPALTRGQADKELIGVNGYLVEWRQSDDVWKPVPWSYSILDTECGVLFETISEEFRTEYLRRARSVPSGTAPPACVRITCCIEGDFRTHCRADRRDISPNGAEHERDFTLSDKFGDRRVCDSGDFQSQFYDERHHEITGLYSGTVLPSQIQIGADLSEWLEEGDRLQIVGGTLNDGTYHVASVSWSSPTLTIDIREALPDDETIEGTLCVLTDEEQPDTKMQGFVEVLQQREDFCLITAEPVVLHGLDRVEYRRGQLIPEVTPRNLSLKSLSASAADAEQRHPQVIGFRYDFRQQHTVLVLEQFGD